jgi:hypothetical protein
MVHEKNGKRRSPRLSARTANIGRKGSFKGCINHAAIQGQGRLAAVKIMGKGMGLKVIGSEPIREGEVIAYGEGTVIGVEDINTEININKYKLYINKTSYLLLHDPRRGFLANLVNTAGRGKSNNAKLTCNKNNNLFTVTALRDIQPGEEVTAAYGAEFTRVLNTFQQPLCNLNFNNFKQSNRKGYYECNICSRSFSLSKCNSHYNLHLN